MIKYALDIRELTVAYNNRPALWRIHALVPSGVMMAIAGPNGAGKSTLIKTIVQLVQPSAGTIDVFGKPYNKTLHEIAYIPQRASIDWDFPISVLDVVLMGTYRHLGWFKRPGNDEKKRALSALDAVGMHEHTTTPIGHLSGGQQQRIFLARALVQDAQLYLMDEPFIGIDTTTQTIILSLLDELRSQGKTIIVVHHDLHTISTHFDWVMLLNIERIAYGERACVLTHQHLIQAYGPLINTSFTHENRCS